MKTTKERLNEKIYIINDDNTIRKDTFRTIIGAHFSDMVITPNGTAPRLHIRIINNSFEVWTWGKDGRSPQSIIAFKDVEDANDFLYEKWLENYDNSEGMPENIENELIFFYSEIDAVNFVKKMKEFNKIKGKLFDETITDKLSGGSFNVINSPMDQYNILISITVLFWSMEISWEWRKKNAKTQSSS